MSQGLFCSPTPQNEAVKSYSPNSLERKEALQELSRQSQTVTEIPLVIGDKVITDRPRTPVYSPHDKSHKIAEACEATVEDIEEAIVVATEAQKSWAKLPWEARAAVFLKAADLASSSYRQKLNASTMLGQSKSIHQAEIDAACELTDFFRFNAKYAEQIYGEQPVYSPSGIWNRSEVRGLEGFVFAATPFNFTSIAINLAAAPCLMGCSVIWKPAPTLMLSSYVGLKLLEEAGLPKGVISFVGGDPGLIGQKVLASKHLAGVHFTGSTNTFQHLWKSVGDHIESYRSYPRIVGETGGKDFVIAHQSADLDALRCALIRGAFEYQGQKCSAASRAFIPKGLWKQLKPSLVEETNSITLGDPKEFHHFMNAVIDKKSYDKIKSYIEYAKTENNTNILCGGECRDDQGYFVRPTIVEVFDPSHKLMVEEIFGPVLTVYAYDEGDLDRTIQACDQSTPYALTGAIFAQDRSVVEKMKDQLVYAAGNFYINDKPTGAVVGQQPFGGSRKSGTNDKAGSPLNLLRWVSHRTVKENFVKTTDYRYPFMEM